MQFRISKIPCVGVGALRIPLAPNQCINMASKIQKQTNELTVDEMLAQLSPSEGPSPTHNMKKDFDKIHAAMQARVKYLQKRKRYQRKRYNGESRQDMHDKKFEPESIRDFIKTTIDLPGVLTKFLSEATTTTMRVTQSIEITYTAMDRLKRTLRSKEFKFTALSMAALTGASWLAQKPTFVVVLLDIIKFLISTLSRFITLTAEQIITAAQEIIGQSQPWLPAQLLEGEQVFEPESMLMVGDYIPMVSGVVSLLGTALVGKQLIATPSLLKNVKSFGEIGRATQGIKQLVENSMGLTTWIFESLQALILIIKENPWWTQILSANHATSLTLLWQRLKIF